MAYQTQPPHLIEARRLVDYLALGGRPSGRNRYKAIDEPNVMTWAERPDDLEGYRNQSRCASFVTGVLRHTYSWATAEYFRGTFGHESPYSMDYSAVFAANRTAEFALVSKMADIRPGDLIAMDFLTGDLDCTGHMAIAVGLHDDGTVEVVDNTARPHGPHDSRVDPYTHQPHPGAGYGCISLIPDESTGEIAASRWHLNAATTHPVELRPIFVARVTRPDER